MNKVKYTKGQLILLEHPETRSRQYHKYLLKFLSREDGAILRFKIIHAYCGAASNGDIYYSFAEDLLNKYITKIPEELQHLYE